MTLAHFASDFDRYTYNRKGLKEPVEEVDMIDNNIENIVAGTEMPLPDGSRLVKRRTSKIIRYVKCSLKKKIRNYITGNSLFYSILGEKNF